MKESPQETIAHSFFIHNILQMLGKIEELTSQKCGTKNVSNAQELIWFSSLVVLPPCNPPASAANASS